MSDFERYSLQIDTLKAVSSILIPLLLAVLALVVHRYKQTVESQLSQSRETIERRFQKYEKISGLCNDIYCFTVLCGHYKSISPVEILSKKRELESLVFTSLPLWTDELGKCILIFLDACFRTGQGRRTTARSLSDIARQKEERNEEWKENWDQFFLTEEERAKVVEVAKMNATVKSYRKDVIIPRYAKVLSELSKNVGGGLSTETAEHILINSVRDASNQKGK